MAGRSPVALVLLLALGVPSVVACSAGEADARGARIFTIEQRAVRIDARQHFFETTFATRWSLDGAEPVLPSALCARAVTSTPTGHFTSNASTPATIAPYAGGAPPLPVPQLRPTLRRVK